MPETLETVPRPVHELKLLPAMFMPLQFTRFDRKIAEAQIAGPIGFTYKGKLVRTGLGLDIESAAAIIEAIQKKYPFYKS